MMPERHKTRHQITVGEGILLGVQPTFRGFHPIWASGEHQVDLCNNVDDVIIRQEGTLYRVPVTAEFLPELGTLVEGMNTHDRLTESPWAEHNIRIRTELLYAATRRVQGAKPQSLCVFDPGTVAPALDSLAVSAVDLALAQLVEREGDTRIPGQ